MASKFRVQAMPFLYVKNGNTSISSNNLKYDGILGLGPMPRLPGDPKVYVQALYDQRLISHNMFSVSLGNIRKNTSHITFGGYDYTYLRTLPGFKNLANDAIDSKITWIGLVPGTNRWLIPLT